MMKFVLLLVCLFVACLAEEHKPIQGAKVMRMFPKTDQHFAAIRKVRDLHDLDVWAEKVEPFRTVDVLIRPEESANVHRVLRQAGVPFHVGRTDLSTLIARETRSNEDAKRRAASIVGTYARHADINAWLSDMCAKYPTVATCITIGKSYLGRDMVVIKLGNAKAKNNLWFDAGIHAREWISPASMIWIIDKMLSKPTDPEVKASLDAFNWYILPVANPDGYEHSHTTYRLWRKTRSLNPSSTCVGTDPNRNFGYKWGVAGASSNPCSDTYKGSKAFSEIETANIRDFILDSSRKWAASISIHAYSQMWLVPWGYGPEKPSDYNELLRVANIGSSALQKVNNKRWATGNVVDLLYAAAGGSDDWAKGSAGIKYAYTLELRPNQSSFNGFVLDASEIKPSAKEVWAGLYASTQAIATTYQMDGFISDAQSIKPSGEEVFAGLKAAVMELMVDPVPDRNPQRHWSSDVFWTDNNRRWPGQQPRQPGWPTWSNGQG